MKSILITREPIECGWLVRSLLAEGFDVVASSQIMLEAIEPLPSMPKTDWIFFNSPKSAKLFFQTYTDLSLGDYKFAGLSTGTSKEVKKWTNRVDYTGSSSLKTEDISIDFLSIVANGDNVLIPCGSQTLGTLKKADEKKQVTEVEFYNTLPNNWVAPTDFDLILFSSPSNVDSYIQTHEIRPDTICLAIGDKTSEAIEKHGLTATISKGYLETDLYKMIMSLAR
jgi:uroporphyrinogen-III synthase|tara:strand:+ start:9797 stop:10471 length:675 start_codon:yes stop_codon:yes gene_type:complete